MTSACSSAFVAAAFAVALLGGGSERAAAQSYPQHPITLIAATAPGGPGDTAGRVIADKMSAILGQPIIVENVSGAGGVIGATRAARATPDGETLLIHQTGITIAAAMDPNLPFNLEKDLAVVGLVNTSYSFLVARKSLPADNLRDLIAWMKGPGRPAKVAHPGKGTLGYLQTLLFAKSIGAEIDAIPYRGIGPAMNDLLGEHVDLIWAGAVTASQFIKAGNIKALAYGAGQRSALLPEVPSAAELGYPEWDMPFWHALFVPAATPRPIIATLNAALQKALTDPQVKKAYADNGVEAFPPDQLSVEAADAYVRGQLAHWKKVVQDNNITE